MTSFEQLSPLIRNDPHVDFETVLTHPDIVTALRSGTDELIGYLSKDVSIHKEFSYIFMVESPKNIIEKKCRRNIVSAICSLCFKLQDSLKDNQIFIDYLVSFTNMDKINNDSSVLGNFTRIVEVFTRLTNGAFMKHFENLPKFLISKIHHLAAQDLFVCIMTEFAGYLSSNDKVYAFGELFDKINGENGFSLVSSINTIITEKPEYLKILPINGYVERLISSLLNGSPLCNKDLYFIESFKFIKSALSANTNSVQNQLKKYEDSFIKDAEVLPYTPYALSVFPSKITLFLPLFFSEYPNTFICETIFKIILTYDSTRLVQFIKENNILSQITDRMGKKCFNGFVYELAFHCVSINAVITQCRGWFRFNDNILTPYLKDKRQNKQAIYTMPSNGHQIPCC